MKERVIGRKDFIISKWSGGETSQLTIYPEDAVFANKDFLFRISSASFTSTESKFSDFTGYQRYILPLEGQIKLYHKGLYERDLKKYEPEYFDGSWSTFSENTLDCIDYNFILKNGSLGKMQILKEDNQYKLRSPNIVTIFSMEEFQVEILGKGSRDMEGHSLLILELDGEEEIKIKSASKPVILTEFIV